MFSFGSVFTSVTCSANIINDKILFIHLDGYSASLLSAGENVHFCTINATLLNRIRGGSHVAIAWNANQSPHIATITKDSMGLAYTDRSSSFQYISSDLVLFLN